MSLRRAVVLVAVSVALAGCHDEEFITVVENAPTGFAEPSSATGLTGFDEEAAAADTGSDGLPRLVFRRVDGASNSQLLFTRRRSTGVWTAPLAVSLNDADAKTPVFAFVTRNNDFTHVLWLEAGQVHYARINNADPPAIDTGGADTVVSGAAPGNYVVAPVASSVTALTAEVDRVYHTIFALWIEDFPSTTSPNLIPVAGEVPSTGPFGNRFALVVPSPTAGCASSSPVLKVSSSGVAHAAWVGTQADGTASLLRYSQRTAAGAWGGGANGEAVSGTADNVLAQPDLLLAGDGDVYAVWVDVTATDILADRRSGGVWGTDSLVFDSVPAAISIRPALEPVSQILHVVWREGAAGGTVSFKAQRQSAADLGGTWLATPETLFSVATQGTDSVEFAAWADSTDRVVVAYQAPAAALDFSRTWVQVHVSKAATFSAATDLTAPFALPCGGLKVAPSGSGTAILVWEQGNGNDLPLSDVFGAVYASGGGVGGAANISASASTGSRAPFVLRMTDAGVGHAFWQETTAAPAIRDVSYARTR